jgi:hypothetical protein
MYEPIDLPVWIVDILQSRATAAGMTFDEAVVASLDIRATDQQAETLGWAASRGVPYKTIARRSRYSVSTVTHAAARFRRRGER